jgi:hypothetical protein
MGDMNPTQEQLYKIECVLKTIAKTMVEKSYCPRYLGLKDGCNNYPFEVANLKNVSNVGVLR